MRHIKAAGMALVYLWSFTISCSFSHAQTNDQSLISKRHNCGDYTILSEPSTRTVLDKHCGSYTDHDLEIMLAEVRRIDPKIEAHAAAQRGDYRLAAIAGGGPPHPDQLRNWAVEGVYCENLEDKDIFIWIRLTDYLAGQTASFQGSMRRFATAYNIAILSEQSFPKVRGCTAITKSN